MNAEERKRTPVYSGVLQYFPNAIKYVSQVSLAGNRQHHPDKPLHWDKSKSTDEADALARHLIDCGEHWDGVDTDGGPAEVQLPLHHRGTYTLHRIVNQQNFKIA